MSFFLESYFNTHWPTQRLFAYSVVIVLTPRGFLLLLEAFWKSSRYTALSARRLSTHPHSVQYCIHTHTNGTHTQCCCTHTKIVLNAVVLIFTRPEKSYRQLDIWLDSTQIKEGMGLDLTVGGSENG